MTTIPAPCTCGASFGARCVCELREALYARGKLIGSDVGVRLYLLDGVVYCARSHTQVDSSAPLAAFLSEDERRGLRGDRRLLRQFFAYDARRVGLAIDPARPWQVCSEFGVLLAQLPTEDRAREAVDTLIRHALTGVLPTNLATWSRADLLA